MSNYILMDGKLLFLHEMKSQAAIKIIFTKIPR